METNSHDALVLNLDKPAHRTQAHPVEVVHNPRNKVELEYVPPPLLKPESQPPRRPWYKTRNVIIVLVILAIVILGAVIGGVVGGTAGKSKSSNNSITQVPVRSDSPGTTTVGTAGFVTVGGGSLTMSRGATSTAVVASLGTGTGFASAGPTTAPALLSTAL